MNSAEVLVKFKGNTEDLEKKSDKAKSVLKGFAGGMSIAFGLATSAVASATAAVAGLVRQSVEAYATFEQLEGGLISLFGEGSAEMNKIMQDSENAWQNLTMSQNDYLTSFQSAYPLVNSGLKENADGIEYTNKMLQLSSDLFNTYGGSIDYYQNAINWALKGSFVYLDNLNLGIKGTQEGFIEAANNAGILGRTINDVSELTTDEIIDVIQHYAEAYGVWGKTAQEAGTTILGSLNMVKATWQNFISGLSKSDADINKLIDNLVNAVITFAGNIVPVIIRAIEGIANALPKVVESLAEMIPDLIGSLLPSIIDAALKLVQSVSANLPQILEILTQGLLQAIEGALTLLPDIIDALLKGVVAIVNAIAKELPTLMPILVDAIVDSISAFFENMPLILEAAIQLMMGIIKAIPVIIKELVKKLPDLIKTIINTMVEYYPALIEGAIDLFMALIDAIPDIVVALVEALPQIIEAIVSGLIEAIPKLMEAIGKIADKLFGKAAEITDTLIANIVQFVQNIPYYIGLLIGYIIGAINKFITQDIPNFINGIITWVSELPGKILNIINEILNWISQLPGKVMQYIADLFQSIVNTIKELPGKMLDIGKNIVEGIWNGIQNAKDWVVKKVKQFAKGILDGMKEALGIHSPSTEFAIIGKYSILGYTGALEDMKDKVQSTIDSVFELQPDINGQMSSTFSPQMNIIVNNNLETDPLGQLVNSVKTFSGGAKNDYNWGAGL